jgi:hypothetical protein
MVAAEASPPRGGIPRDHPIDRSGQRAGLNSRANDFTRVTAYSGVLPGMGALFGSEEAAVAVYPV